MHTQKLKEDSINQRKTNSKRSEGPLSYYTNFRHMLFLTVVGSQDIVSGNILQTELWVTNNSRTLVSGFELSFKNPSNYFLFYEQFATVSKRQHFPEQINITLSLKLYLLQMGQNKTRTCLNSHWLPIEWQILLNNTSSSPKIQNKWGSKTLKYCFLWTNLRN